MPISNEILKMLIPAAIAVFVLAVLGNNLITDSMLGSTTANANTIMTVAYAALVVAGVAILAFAGRWVMNIFH